MTVLPQRQTSTEVNLLRLSNGSSSSPYTTRLDHEKGSYELQITDIQNHKPTSATGNLTLLEQ
jgi:hypothetical protein